MKTIKLAKLLLLLQASVFALDNYVVLQTEEAEDTPTHFKEGLPQYVSISSEEDGVQTALGQFLLCTSCTISYMFGVTPGGTPEKISFREHPDPGDEIEVYFEERTLLFNKTIMKDQNEADDYFRVTMQIGIIDKKY